MGAQKLLRDHVASASLRHPQMAPALSSQFCTELINNEFYSTVPFVPRRHCHFQQYAPSVQAFVVVCSKCLWHDEMKCCLFERQTNRVLDRW